MTRCTSVILAAIALLAVPAARAAGAEPAAIRTLPPARGGQDLVGKRLPALEFDRWVRPPEPSAEAPLAQATLYRWWTDTCPYCRASLPAVEQLRRDYADRGLRVVGVYHPKPPRDVADGDVLAVARRLGYGGSIALDADWSALTRAYRTTGRRRATSVSLLVDGDGVIRFVHPGPVFFPSDDPEFARENDDFRRLEQAIEVLLDAPVAPTEHQTNRSPP